MKILYDARWILTTNRFDGISRYSHELAHALSARSDMEITWLIHDKKQLKLLPPGNHLLVNNPENKFKEFFVLARTINKSGHKLVYSPFFVMGSLGKKYQLVLTIHDLIYFTHRTPPQWLDWHVRLFWRLFHLSFWPLRLQLSKADIIATVSDTSRQKLIDKKVTKREIITVPNAVSSNFKSISKSNHFQSKNIVYMGAFTPYKNVECLIDALQYLPDMTIDLCSKLPAARRKELSNRMRKIGVADRVKIHNGVTDDEYKNLLKNARCSVTASRLEGFGLPVLESQVHGVPFACSDIPIFHEVGQKSVVYFDPNSPKSAAKAIEKLADKKTSQAYIELGFKNVERYTWDKSAEAAASICRGLGG